MLRGTALSERRRIFPRLSPASAFQASNSSDVIISGWVPHPYSFIGARLTSSKPAAQMTSSASTVIFRSSRSKAMAFVGQASMQARQSPQRSRSMQ